MLRFDAQLADLGAREFVEHVLVGALGVRTVLVGATSASVAAVPATPSCCANSAPSSASTSTSSTTCVRSTPAGACRRRGSASSSTPEMSRRRRSCSGAPRRCWGEVVHGLKRGRELGFPTANLSPDLEGFVPAEGVYAGWLDRRGLRRTAHPRRGQLRYPAAISIGTNPTFDDVPVRQVEAYVLDETDLDLYGHIVEMEFVSRIRGMVAFEGVEPLIAQMSDDIVRVRRELS